MFVMGGVLFFVGAAHLEILKHCFVNLDLTCVADFDAGSAAAYVYLKVSSNSTVHQFVYVPSASFRCCTQAS